jgi:hypothetical protein
MPIAIEKINALAELQRAGWDYTPKGDEEVGICCPVHGDKTASASLNVAKNLWRCHAAGCNAKGDIVSLLAHIARVERKVVLADLGTRYDLQTVRSLSPEIVERYASKVFSAGPLLKALRDRGLTDEMIRKAKLGYHDGRITIPVFGESGEVLNIRAYLPGAPSHEKMLNRKGFSKPALYQVEQIKRGNNVWICGGEMKALVVGSLLAKHKIGAVSATAGEGAWETAWTARFKDKDVYVCMDVDSGGKAAARKIAREVFHVAASVKIIRLPLDKARFPKGDVNDFVGKLGAKAPELLALMESADVYTPQELASDEEGPVLQVRLSETTSAANMGKTICFSGTLTSLDETPYIVPQRIRVSCSRDQPNCHICPVQAEDEDETTGTVALTIKGTSIGLLTMIEAPVAKQREAIREALRIPPCKVASFTIESSYNIYDVRVSPQLQIGGGHREHVVVPAFIVSPVLPDLNSPYVFQGRVHPDPRTQHAVLLLNELSRTEDSLAAFTLTAEDVKSLDVFCGPIEERLHAIYTDLSLHVTRICQRPDLHFCIDLAYHSPMYIRFEDQTHRGWINALVVGDSAQGKSEVSQRLMEHYGLGERVDCKNASVAGLLGGLQQHGTRYIVTWGMIPQHDGRLLFMEEVKGAAPEIIARLTDMRSSGVAELPKIERRRAHARTRLVMISNPRSDRAVAAFNFGVEAIHELIPGLEDIRRFDVALVVSSRQVNAREINEFLLQRSNEEPVFSGPLCRKLVLWAWTRKPDQVQFTRDAELCAMEEASKLCEEFTDALPLIDRGTTKLKLARLAAALAARLFSHDPEDPSVLLVKKEHVLYITAWLRKVYGDEVFGYAEYSRAQQFAVSLVDPDVIQRMIRSLKHPRDFCELILHTDRIARSDIEDWGDCDAGDAQKFLSFLVRKHAVYRSGREYIKTPGFIDLLKRIRTSMPTTAEVSQKEKF